ncbi:MAG: nucleoside-diphosphate kinase [Actinomycetota bacterium]|nr:nucleoside-diphosphate kinase [Actinomycetota bacterium]
MWRGSAPGLLDRLRTNGIYATHLKLLQPHPRLIEEMYRYTQTRLMEFGNRPMWWLTPRYYALCPAAFLLLIGEGDSAGRDVTASLKALKGPSNPALGEPGQLRYDFDAQNIVMCVVHTSESTVEVLREACLFFSQTELDEAIEAAIDLRRSGRVPNGIDERPLHTGTIDVDVHNFFSLMCSIQRRLLGLIDASGAADAEDALEEAERAARRTDGYRQRAALTDDLWRQVAGVPERANDAAGEPALALLRALSNPASFFPILADELIRSLHQHSIELSPWDELLLETGLAFHQLQIAGFSPNPT